MRLLLRTDDTVRRNLFAIIWAEQPCSTSARKVRKSSGVQDAARLGRNTLEADDFFICIRRSTGPPAPPRHRGGPKRFDLLERDRLGEVVAVIRAEVVR